MELPLAIVSGQPVNTHSDRNTRHRTALFYFSQYEFDDWESGDQLFGQFGIGVPTDITERPFERFHDYEELLQQLQQADARKFAHLVKGTPYYLMAWLCFQMEHFEKGIFYMDATISEDIRKQIQIHLKKTPGELRTTNQLTIALQPDWIKSNSGLFFTLTNKPFFKGVEKIIDGFAQLFSAQLVRFSAESQIILTQADFNNRFINVLAAKPQSRSIITSFYSFIFEYPHVRKLIELRSMSGGTIEPILRFLFKGGLILESLFKDKYAIGTLGAAKNHSGFTTKHGSFDTSAIDLNAIVNRASDNTKRTAFSVTAMTRNTTGHNLQWDDVFNNPGNLDKLYFQIVNAIFYFMDGEY